VLNMEVVLASGEVVNANKTHNADLFKALKGGGNNFGILTRVDVKTTKRGPTDKIWGGQIIVPATRGNIRQGLEGLVEFTTANNDNVHAALQFGMKYDRFGLKFMDVAPATTDGSIYPPIFSKLTSLWPRLMNTMRVAGMPSFVDEYEELQPNGYRQTFATMTVVNDLDTVIEVQAIIDDLYNSVKNSVRGLDWTFLYQPQPRVIQQFATESTGNGNSLGLNENAHDQMSKSAFPPTITSGSNHANCTAYTVVFMTPRWSHAEDDEVVYEALRTWEKRVHEASTRRGTADPFLYMNFAGPSQKPLCSYGEASLRFMREVSTKYDPEQVFQRLVPGGFKLSKAC
jgi:hypothetical protein